jgi:MoxR-vWA-beta-propeller ternary system domain bpX2
MSVSLDEVCCASLSHASLAALAGLRALPGLRMNVVGERAWLHWPAGDEQVLRRVQAVAGVELFVRRAGLWYRHGRHLPSFDVPGDAETQPLCRVLTPVPVRAEFGENPALRPAVLRLVREDRPRATTGMRCEVTTLAAWADSAPTARLAALRAARRGAQVLLLGHSLPELPDAERFWGGRLLLPLGFRAEPALPENALLEALGLAQDEILVFGASGPEVVPRGVLQPLTRAGVRLAVRGTT